MFGAEQVVYAFRKKTDAAVENKVDESGKIKRKQTAMSAGNSGLSPSAAFTLHLRF